MKLQSEDKDGSEVMAEMDKLKPQVVDMATKTKKTSPKQEEEKWKNYKQEFENVTEYLPGEGTKYHTSEEAMGKRYSGIDLIELVAISVDNELLKYYFSYLLCILSFLCDDFHL